MIALLHDYYDTIGIYDIFTITRIDYRISTVTVTICCNATNEKASINPQTLPQFQSIIFFYINTQIAVALGCKYRGNFGVQIRANRATKRYALILSGFVKD